MAKISYQRVPSKLQSVGRSQTTEVVVPMVLMSIGLALYGIKAFFHSGSQSAIIVMWAVLIIATAQTIVGIAAAFITANLLGASFGELRPAFMKLGAIIILCGALASLIPFGGALVLFVYLGFIIWLFGLEVYEAIIFAIVFAIVQFGVYSALASMILH